MGLATEGAKALIQYGFKEANLKEIVAVVLPENRASVKVIEKCRFTYRRMAEFYHKKVLYYTLSRKV